MSKIDHKIIAEELNKIREKRNFISYSIPHIIQESEGEAARDWWIMDNERDPYNDTAARVLWPNDEAVEQNYTNYNIDFVADGFKVRGDNNKLNGSNETYIYLAFAESPFKTSLAR